MAVLLKRIKYFCDYTKHEDLLINQRTTWLLASQSILFAATAAILIAALRIDDWNLELEFALFVIMLFCIFGILFCRATFISISAADKALHNLDDIWKNEWSSHSHGLLPTITGGEKSYVSEDVDFSKSNHGKGSYISRRLPLIFGLIWVILLCYIVGFFTINLIQKSIKL